jgi:hypothetical protein
MPKTANFAQTSSKQIKIETHRCEKNEAPPSPTDLISLASTTFLFFTFFRSTSVICYYKICWWLGLNNRSFRGEGVKVQYTAVFLVNILPRSTVYISAHALLHAAEPRACFYNKSALRMRKLSLSLFVSLYTVI